MRRWLPFVLVAAAVIFSLAVFSRLPERVPVHWGISGEPDRYGSRFEGAFLLPIVTVAVLALLRWLPSRDPRAANIEKFRDSYDLMIIAFTMFMTGLHVLLLGSSLGWTINVSMVVLIGVGMLFMVLGNMMPRARSNFLFGVRTPWTLSSDAVWMRSNRLAGYAMVAAGAVTIAGAFLGTPWAFIVALTSIAVAAIIPIVYSYVLWSREQGGPSGQ